MSFPYRRCWAEVDLNAIVENCRLCHRSAETMAVVKADAYGHGDIPVSQALQTRLGIRNFAVSNLDEAIRLRTHGIEGQILILGYTPIQNFPELLEHDITQAILDEDYAGASKTLDAVKEPNATTAYLKAIVGARTNDKAAVIENLKSAIAPDANMKARAASDIEFSKFAEDAEFQAIVK